MAERRRAARADVPVNVHGIVGMDHVAMPARDPKRAASFYIEALGGTLAKRVVETYRADQHRQQDVSVVHYFIHVGGVMVQVAYPSDGRSFTDRDSVCAWPHWAFGGSPAAVDNVATRLKALGVPYSGPWLHGIDGNTSIYFCDPEGNKLEMVTYDPYPNAVKRMGTDKDGFPVWQSLKHDWQPTRQVVD